MNSHYLRVLPLLLLVACGPYVGPLPLGFHGNAQSYRSESGPNGARTTQQQASVGPNGANASRTSLESTMESGPSTSASHDLLAVDNAPEPAPAPAPPANTATSTSTIRCCVNKAYYTCPDGAAAGRCLGNPGALMNCAMSCSGGDCQQQCIASHGPKPSGSGCQRDPGRDGDCR